MAQGIDADVASRVAYSKPVRKAEKAVKRKVRRKVTKYQKELGKQMKKLKRKHPRSKMSALLKRAHSATKRALK